MALMMSSTSPGIVLSGIAMKALLGSCSHAVETSFETATALACSASTTRQLPLTEPDWVIAANTRTLSQNPLDADLVAAVSA
jgi:hypothetical protein